MQLHFCPPLGSPPARSTRCSTLDWPTSSVRRTDSSAWERELCAFMLVAAVARLREPSAAGESVRGVREQAEGVGRTISRHSATCSNPLHEPKACDTSSKASVHVTQTTNQQHHVQHRSPASTASTSSTPPTARHVNPGTRSCPATSWPAPIADTWGAQGGLGSSQKGGTLSLLAAGRADNTTAQLGATDSRFANRSRALNRSHMHVAVPVFVVNKPSRPACTQTHVQLGCLRPSSQQVS